MHDNTMQTQRLLLCACGFKQDIYNVVSENALDPVRAKLYLQQPDNHVYVWGVYKWLEPFRRKWTVCSAVSCLTTTGCFSHSSTSKITANAELVWCFQI